MANVIRLHGDQHKQTQTLLPWYANGTLEPEELAAVEAHLAECAECRAELDSERELGRQIANLPEQGWAAMRNRLDAQPQRRTRPPVAFLRRPVPIGWALAAQAACLALVAVGVAWLSAPSRPAPQAHAIYRALGSAPTASAGNVVVMFQPTTTVAELRDVLRQNGARLVDGPTASDAYVLSVASAQRTSALSRLRSDQHVVLAEPIDGEGHP